MEYHLLLYPTADGMIENPLLFHTQYALETPTEQMCSMERTYRRDKKVKRSPPYNRGVTEFLSVATLMPQCCRRYINRNQISACPVNELEPHRYGDLIQDGFLVGYMCHKNYRRISNGQIPSETPRGPCFFFRNS